MPNVTVVIAAFVFVAVLAGILGWAVVSISKTNAKSLDDLGDKLVSTIGTLNRQGVAKTLTLSGVDTDLEERMLSNGRSPYYPPQHRAPGAVGNNGPSPERAPAQNS